MDDDSASDETDPVSVTAALNRQWTAAHAKRVAAIGAELVRAYPAPTQDERVLLGLAGHDMALAELVGNAQLLLARRVEALVDNPKVALQLARALQQVTACRNAASTRVEELLRAVNTTRVQRSLTQSPHLRRVA